MAYLYIVLCEGNTYYTGIAVDIERRLAEHRERGKKCARYTRAHPVKRLVALWQTDSYAHAAKGDYAVKKLSRQNKEHLIRHPEQLCLICPALNFMEFTVCEFTHSDGE